MDCHKYSLDNDSLVVDFSGDNVVGDKALRIWLLPSGIVTTPDITEELNSLNLQLQGRIPCH
jgi:hypothetical protein